MSTLVRRTPLNRSSKPMSKGNSTFYKSSKPMNKGHSTLKRSNIKRSFKRKQQIEGYHDKDFLEACRGEPCYLNVEGVCLGEHGRSTVVPCHSNQSAHGKGMGLKAKDNYTVPGCMACHGFIDQSSAPKNIKFEYWNAAYERWLPVRKVKIGK